jgi:hypothetical protein
LDEYYYFAFPKYNFLGLARCSASVGPLQVNNATQLGYKRRHINSQCNTRPGNWYHAEPGYAKEEHPANFDYISLLDIPRKERFSILTQYLHHVR